MTTVLHPYALGRRRYGPAPRNLDRIGAHRAVVTGLPSSTSWQDLKARFGSTRAWYQPPVAGYKGGESQGALAKVRQLGAYFTGPSRSANRCANMQGPADRSRKQSTAT